MGAEAMTLTVEELDRWERWGKCKWPKTEFGPPNEFPKLIAAARAHLEGGPSMSEIDSIAEDICNDLDADPEAIPLVAQHLMGLAAPLPSEGETAQADNSIAEAILSPAPPAEGEPCAPSTPHYGLNVKVVYDPPAEGVKDDAARVDDTGAVRGGELRSPVGLTEGEKDVRNGSVDSTTHRNCPGDGRGGDSPDVAAQVVPDIAKLVERLRRWRPQDLLMDEAVTALEALRKECEGRDADVNEQVIRAVDAELALTKAQDRIWVLEERHAIDLEKCEVLRFLVKDKERLLQNQEAEDDRLREALETYADDSLAWDSGHVARAALKEKGDG